MDLIDDKGRLFGTVNIIDALAVLLVLAVVAAGAALVLGDDGQQTNTDRQTTTTVAFEISGVQPYVADAVPEGPIDSESVAAVENKSVRPTEVVVKDQNGNLHERTHPRKQTVTLELTLNTTETDDGVRFEGEPLEVGRQLKLDFGPVTLDGHVTAFSPGN
ncbi:DUF4330 domain-containing protein [Halorussus marinus]|uniref:DUF4330 domain-containing protein n=1 Tax=Halorussus marinus TaxID=2505976 RepID=UPI0010927E99|nr:DUF4330 domain-containing protein [Halorussus marinus]